MSNERKVILGDHMSYTEQTENNLYKNKYLALKRRCEEIQLTNEKIVNRIRHVKRLIRRDKKAKKFMMAKLDGYGDNYMNVQVPTMFDETVGQDETIGHCVHNQQKDINLDLSHDSMNGKPPPNVNPFY